MKIFSSFWRSKQTLFLSYVVIIFIVSAVLTPWRVYQYRDNYQTGFIGYGPFWANEIKDINTQDLLIDYPRLFTEIFIITLIMGTILLMVKSKRE